MEFEVLLKALLLLSLVIIVLLSVIIYYLAKKYNENKEMTDSEIEKLL